MIIELAVSRNDTFSDSMNGTESKASVKVSYQTTVGIMLDE